MNEILKKHAYSVYDVAKVCNVPQPTVMDWLRGGTLPFFETPGGHMRIAHRVLEEFLNQSNRKIPHTWKDQPEKFRILVVEDDIELLQLILDILRDDPLFEVTTESDGFHAVLKVGSWHPDLVMLDFVLPGLSGFEVCKRIRDNEQTRDIPVLAVSSLSNEENRRAIFAAGVSDALPKPFYSEDLIRKIKLLLGVEASLKP